MPLDKKSIVLNFRQRNIAVGYFDGFAIQYHGTVSEIGSIAADLVFPNQYSFRPESQRNMVWHIYFCSIRVIISHYYFSPSRDGRVDLLMRLVELGSQKAVLWLPQGELVICGIVACQRNSSLFFLNPPAALFRCIGGGAPYDPRGGGDSGPAA